MSNIDLLREHLERVGYNVEGATDDELLNMYKDLESCRIMARKNGGGNATGTY